MERSEIKRIADFLRDVYEGICEQDGPHLQQIQLNELYGVIQTLMDEIAETEDERHRLFLCCLEKRAIEYKDAIEKRLAVRN
jgi:hypothetical protein